MNTTARDRLVQVLAGGQAPSSDAAMLRLPIDSLTLHVSDVGPVKLPVRAAQAKRLIALARPARFGHGEETIADPTVRDTWELTPDQVIIGGPDWDAHLASALAHFRYELGMPATAELRADLHSLLVYGKGQFFLPHQDSEKHDDMIATLVVIVPSVHTGGELVIDDGGTDVTMHASRDELVLVAFYTDRRHEVKPVRSGYRVTLTFNLMLTEPATPNQPRGPADEVSRYLNEHFASPVTSTYVGEDPREPIRLAFLLDHEYTQAGLSSGRFKGADVNRVALLRDAAERADCETVFALAEVQESCSAIPKGATWHYDCYGGGYYGGGQPDPAGDSTEVNVDDYDLGSPNHRAMTLGWWVGAEGSGAEPINLDLLRDEICTVTNSNSLKPYASAYHGYMGNDGNTLDRWYRGAAVVVWPKAKSFAARAEATPTLALSGLLSRIVAGDLEGARADAASLEPVWRRVDPAILPLAVDVAVALRDPQAARVVMEPFALEVLTTEHAAGLAALAREYGAPWMNEVVERWGTVRRHVGAGRFDWVADTLPALCQALRECDASALADSIGDRVWRSLSTHVNVGVRETRGDQRNVDLFALGLPLARLLEAVSDPVGVRIIAELHTLDDNVMELLVAILRAHRPPARAAIRAIADDCCERVTRLVEAPVHTPDDSTSWTGCGCELCLRLESFLAAPSQRTLTWQLATPGREHVQRQLDAAALPVRHTTRRQGRPFTLVVEKTA